MNERNFWRDGLRILCVRLDNLGDVLMTTPAFQALKTTWPACELTLLTSSAGEAIADYIPEIDHTIRFDVPWMHSGADTRAQLLPFANQLSTYAFDAAILFTVQSQSPLPAALLCYLAGIPRVLGYCRENPYQLITDWVPDAEVLVATRHEVERQLALVETVGCRPYQTRLTLAVPPSERQAIKQLLSIEGLRWDQPWLVLHPGVSEAKRRYPASQFAQASSQLRQRFGYQIIITGSVNEKPLTDAIEKQVCADAPDGLLLNLTGRLTIGQLGALLAEAPLLLANNTGPVHMAAALGTPTVVLYAKTNPQHTPWQVPNRVLYFEVPAALRSKNALLQQFPPVNQSVVLPGDIVQAVTELTSNCSFIPTNTVCTH